MKQASIGSRSSLLLAGGRAASSSGSVALAAASSAPAFDASSAPPLPPPRRSTLSALLWAGLALLLAVSLVTSAVVVGSAHGGGGAAAAKALAGSDRSASATRAGAPAAARGPGAGATLLAVQVVFRHGARTPLNTKFFRGVKWESERCGGGGDGGGGGGGGDEAGGAYEGAAEISIRDGSGAATPPPLVDATPDAAPPLPGGCPQGTLTANGFGMAVRLGRDLRRRYVSPSSHSQQSGGGGGGGGGDEGQPPHPPPPPLLPPTAAEAVAAGALALHATNYRRTRATLRGVLAGLYPDAVAGGAGGVKFAVNATRERFTFLYPSNGSCPKVGPVVAELMARANARELAASTEPAERVRAALGLPAADEGESDGGKPFDWGALRDALSCMLAESPELRPPGLDDGLWRLVQRRATAFETAVFAPSVLHNCAVAAQRCRDLVRWSVGPLLWRFVSHFEAAARAAADEEEEQQQQQQDVKRESGRHGRPRLFLYSAHDSTIHATLAALGHRTRRWAPFTAALALELWRGREGDGTGVEGGGGGGDDDDWVRVLYNGRPVDLDNGGGGDDDGYAGGSSAAGEQAQGEDGGRERQVRRWRRAARAELARSRRGWRDGPASAAAQQQQQAEHEEEDDGGGNDGGDGTSDDEREGGMPGSSDGGESPGGWVRLGDLKLRLRPFTATDEEKARECWG